MRTGNILISNNPSMLMAMVKRLFFSINILQAEYGCKSDKYSVAVEESWLLPTNLQIDVHKAEVLATFVEEQ